MSSPRTEPLNVLIVGGGIAGIVLAILLERKGDTVTLIEQSKEWKPVGGGVTLTLNGVRILQSLGLLHESEEGANQIRNINITDQFGSILSSFNLDEYTATYARTVTIHRHCLHSILLGHLARTTILSGTVFSSIQNEADKVKVVLSNGGTAYYDLVVGCDGINSSVRDSLFANVKKKYAGYASWRFVVNNADGIDKKTLTEMWGVGKRFGIVPLTHNRVHCFAAVNTAQNSDAHHNISVASFKKIFADFGGHAPRLLDVVKHHDELMYNDLEDVYVREWCNGRVVLIGDAAHGMTPNMTQGVSMAIEDAYTLANILMNSTGVKMALTSFCEARKKRVLAIQRKSNLFGKIGHINIPALCRLRNYCWQHIPDKWIQNDLKNLLVTDAPNF